MKLTELAAKPKLIEIKIDDKDTVEKYGEPVSFWIYDRQDIETFIKMTTISSNDFAQAASIVKELIRDENGKHIVQDDTTLPTDLMMKAVVKVIEELGKSMDKSPSDQAK